jgi:TonB family protein
VPAEAGVQLAAHPRSAPDLDQLHGLTFSGLPMRIRLLIDDRGRVTDAKVLETSEADDVTAAVLRVFEETAFVPARRNGIDVASELDIELSFDS